MNCPCGNNTEYKNCCEPYIEGQKKPDTAEKLMRARYTAYVQSKVDYLLTTLAPESRSDFDLNAAKQWAKTAKWKGLKIISTEKGGPDDSVGTVEFIATYSSGKESLDHHEVSKFRKSDRGEWFFLDGDSHTHKEGEEHHHHVKPQTVIREEAKIGRNDPCTCGSGKKYKKCCGTEA